MTYTNTVFDNYYKLSFDDRITLINKITALQDEYLDYFRCNYSRSLERILFMTEIMKDAKEILDLYSSLDEKEKKEFQTRVYTFSSWSKHENFFTEHDADEYIPVLLKKKCDDNKEDYERFEVDFDKIDKEFDSCYEIGGLNPEKVVSVFTRNFYDFIFCESSTYRLTDEQQKVVFDTYSKPLIKEFNEIMEKCSYLIKRNVNTSTRKNFSSLSFEKQVYAIIRLQGIDIDFLDRRIEERRQLREEKKQANKVEVIEEVKPLLKHYVKKRRPVANYRSV